MLMFLLDFAAEQYVERKYGFAHTQPNVERLVTDHPSDTEGAEPLSRSRSLTHQQLHSGDQDEELHIAISRA
jgi:zinc transporter 1/2/3